MDNFFVNIGILLTLTIGLCIIRGILGATSGDRLMAMNVIGTKTIILISIVSFVMKETYFIDVVIVYSMINFLGSVGIAKLIEEEQDNG